MENCMTNRQANPTILPLHVHDNQNGLDYTLHGDYYSMAAVILSVMTVWMELM